MEIADFCVFCKSQNYVDVIIGIKFESQKEVRAQQLLNICGVPQWPLGIFIHMQAESSGLPPRLSRLP